MSFIQIKPVFSTVAVSLGQVTVTSDTNIVKGKQEGKVKTKYYFAFFTLKTPNKAYLLESDTPDCIVPKLSEVVKLPHISLDKCDIDNDTPKTVLTSFVNWFNRPMEQIDGVSPYDLFTQGFITTELFYDVVNRSLAPLLASRGTVLDSDKQEKIVRHLHELKASQMGIASFSGTLAEKVTQYLNQSQSVNDDAKVVRVKKQVDTIDVPSKPVQEPDPVPSPDPVVVSPSDISVTTKAYDLSLPIEKWSSKQRKAYLKEHGLYGSKYQQVEIERITEHLTAPSPAPANV